MISQSRDPREKMASRKPTYGPEHEGVELRRLEQDRTREKVFHSNDDKISDT